ncbi:MAG: DUF6776 family protein [Halieaceae bacterium]|jgi:hypothetical protein
MKQHQHRTVVKRVHPHEWRWRVSAAAGALLVALLVGYLWGASRPSDMPFFNSPEERLQDQVAQLQQEREADQQTLQALQSTLSDKVSEIAEMREMLALYRGVMLPEETGDLVLSRAPTIDYDPRSQTFSAVALVHRGSGDFSEYRGEMALILEGNLLGQPYEVNLAALDTAAETSVFPLSFRYLQKVQIAVSLPEGFEPETLVSSVSLKEPRRATSERRDPIVGSAVTGLANVGAESEASDSKIR